MLLIISRLNLQLLGHLLTFVHIGTLDRHPWWKVSCEESGINMKTFDYSRDPKLVNTPVMSRYSLASCFPTIHPFAKRCEHSFTPLRITRLRKYATSFSCSSLQKEQFRLSLIPIFVRKSFVAILLCKNLYWNSRIHLDASW